MLQNVDDVLCNAVLTICMNTHYTLTFDWTLNADVYFIYYLGVDAQVLYTYSTVLYLVKVVCKLALEVYCCLVYHFGLSDASWQYLLSA